MATFEYTALKDNKTIIKGKVDAPDKAAAKTKIRELGLIPTQVYDSNSVAVILYSPIHSTLPSFNVNASELPMGARLFFC